MPEVPEVPAVAHALGLVRNGMQDRYEANVSPRTRRLLAEWLRLHPGVLHRDDVAWVQESISRSPYPAGEVNGPGRKW